MTKLRQSLLGGWDNLGGNKTFQTLHFQAIWELVSLNIPTSYIMDLLRDISQQS